MDGLIYATSIAAALAADVAHGLGDGLADATVTLSAVALAGSYELLVIIRSAAGLPEQSAQPRQTHDLRQMRAFSMRSAMHSYTACRPAR